MLVGLLHLRFQKSEFGLGRILESGAVVVLAAYSLTRGAPLPTKEQGPVIEMPQLSPSFL